MKKTHLAILALSIIGFSCKKSSTSAPDAQKYMDFTAGSTWKYQTTNNLTAAISLNTRTSTSRDSAITGRTYHVFTNSDGTPNEYYNITTTASGNDYYTFRSLGAAL